MPFSVKKLTRAITLALGVVSAQLSHAVMPFQFPLDLPYDYWFYAPATETSSLDNHLTRRATTDNGRQVARMLEPALKRLLESGQLSSQQIKALEKLDAALAKRPGEFGMALEQLAASQNANLAAATQATTEQISGQLLSVLRARPTDEDGHFWVQGLSDEGSLDKQGGSAGLNYGTQGLMLGADWALDHAWRVGVMGAKSTSDLDAQRFSADLDSWHLGGYAVRQDGPLSMRLGAIYSSHAGQNIRTVQIVNRKESLKGSYDAQSQNVFSEWSYQLGNGDLSVEPFAGLGYQRYYRERFKERGGLTALNVGAQNQQNLNSTLGLRLATVYRFDNRMSLTPYVSTHWKHLYGNVDSQVSQSFRTAAGFGTDFTINGTALDRNSLNLQAGLDLALSNEHTVGLAYTGESGTHSRNHGLMGRWRVMF
ncbi:autotransporter outer membrane beta-barrel domain-containing protein [Pseudomonas pergaminensis]